MNPKPILCACLAALACAAPAQGSVLEPLPLAAKAEFLGYAAGFRLQGTNGYDLFVSAYSERRDGKGEMVIAAARRNARYGSGALYVAPAVVSADFFKADLGALGRIDLAIHPSGQKEKIHIRCSRQTYLFETGFYEGTVEFEGEGDYTSASATQIPFQPYDDCGGGGGSSETRGPGLPGAVLKGVSFAHGRRLSFKFNKNHRLRGQVPYSLELRERRDGIQIQRLIEGTAPAESFHFEPSLSSARLSPPAPFDGSATLRRRPNSVTPSWTGDLNVDFPGHPNVPLAGPGVFVSLRHACFTRSGNYAAGHSC
jgi:hypothetical protein